MLDKWRLALAAILVLSLLLAQRSSGQDVPNIQVNISPNPLSEGDVALITVYVSGHGGEAISRAEVTGEICNYASGYRSGTLRFILVEPGKYVCRWAAIGVLSGSYYLKVYVKIGNETYVYTRQFRVRPRAPLKLDLNVPKSVKWGDTIEIKISIRSSTWLGIGNLTVSLNGDYDLLRVVREQLRSEYLVQWRVPPIPPGVYEVKASVDVSGLGIARVTHKLVVLSPNISAVPYVAVKTYQSLLKPGDVQTILATIKLEPNATPLSGALAWALIKGPNLELRLALNEISPGVYVGSFRVPSVARAGVYEVIVTAEHPLYGNSSGKCEFTISSGERHPFITHLRVFVEPKSIELYVGEHASVYLTVSPPADSPLSSLSLSLLPKGCVKAAVESLGEGVLSERERGDVRVYELSMNEPLKEEKRVLRINVTCNCEGSYGLIVTGVEAVNVNGDRLLVAENVPLVIAVKCKAMPGDINGDGKVDLEDLMALLEGFGASEGEPGYSSAADLNSDGRIDFLDLSIMVALMGG